ncbi:unnamed protein product [Paramecium sonneborni]|uniref:Uncharacterized protein n=1 Tax=Paramecium sonneborni TaxID=65129 RepID=A0A8S1REH3_9CILI|nr:unnamed protein product [Paramecium sonneborni]
MSIYIRIQHSTHIFSDSYYQTNEIEQFNDCVSHQDSKIKQKKKGQKRFKNQNDNDVNQSFENQNNVYQSLENQSPKIKKELSLINQNLIKQIPFKKRKKFTLEY